MDDGRRPRRGWPVVGRHRFRGIKPAATCLRPSGAGALVGIAVPQVKTRGYMTAPLRGWRVGRQSTATEWHRRIATGFNPWNQTTQNHHANPGGVTWMTDVAPAGAGPS